jgi:hypothetical protein
MTNLLRESWNDLDSAELRVLLDHRIGGPGQYRRHKENPNKLYLPLAGADCRVALTFRGNKIASIEPGLAFDAGEWQRVVDEIESSILTGPIKIGREWSFSSYRVLGSWRGARSGIQIVPPPDGTPRPPVEDAEHPFILEFPMGVTNLWPVTNHRRIREHRTLTHLLNILLAGRTSLQPRRSAHFWASVPGESPFEVKWSQQFFFAKIGPAVIDALSAPAAERLRAIDAQTYYTEVRGLDGEGLRVPADLDDSICLYLQLSPAHRRKFDRAAFWIDMAARQWPLSMSSSFASVVSAIESLTERGSSHRVYCEICKAERTHEVPGAIERFRAFFEEYAPGEALRARRTEMYELRSGILHGSTLMDIDEDLDFGWDPPCWNQRELHNELWSVTRIALRNWLKCPQSVVT